MSKIKSLIGRLRKSEIFRNTAILSSGTVLAQIIAVFTSPVLTRIYHPSDYGVLGLFMVFTALIAAISTLQYHNAIITAESDDEGKAVLQLSIVLIGVVSLMVFILDLFLKHVIVKAYGSEELGEWLWLAPFSVLFQGVNLAFSAWAIRLKRFKLLSFNRISTAVLAPVFSISLGLLTASAMGLFVGLLVSQILPTIRMAYHFLNQDERLLRIKKNDLKVVFKKHRNFRRFSFPATLLNNFSNQMPAIILSHTAGAAVVGWYNLSARMLSLPATLIATSIGDVFRQRASQDYYEKGTCRPIFIKVFKTLVLVSLPPFIILLLFGPFLFSLVFGEDWRGAGIISQVLAVLYLVKFSVSPLSFMTLIANKQWIGLGIDIILLATLSLVFYIANFYHLHYTITLLIFALSYSLLYSITFTVSYRLTINKNFKQKRA